MNEFKEVYENVDLKKYSTLKVGGICKYLVNVSDEKELSKLIKYCNENKIKYFILGNGSNVIIDDHYFDGVVIKLNHLDKIRIDGDIVVSGSGVMMPKLVNIMLEHNLVSLASLATIPGTVGGCVVGNAGCFNTEVMDYLLSVKAIDKEGNIVKLLKEDIEYSYRKTSLRDNYIVLEATFSSEEGNPLEVLSQTSINNEKRLLTQPLDQKNVGSIFKNPEGFSAGKLIDEAGLKGKRIGGAKVSEKHANFIVNDNNASFNDVCRLIKHIQDKIYKKYKIKLEVEPKIIRWDEI